MFLFPMKRKNVGNVRCAAASKIEMLLAGIGDADPGSAIPAASVRIRRSPRRMGMNRKIILASLTAPLSELRPSRPPVCRSGILRQETWSFPNAQHQTERSSMRTKQAMDRSSPRESSIRDGAKNATSRSAAGIDSKSIRNILIFDNHPASLRLVREIYFEPLRPTTTEYVILGLLLILAFALALWIT